MTNIKWEQLACTIILNLALLTRIAEYGTLKIFSSRVAQYSPLVVYQSILHYMRVNY
jgi:hypothetical protein